METRPRGKEQYPWPRRPEDPRKVPQVDLGGGNLWPPDWLDPNQYNKTVYDGVYFHLSTEQRPQPPAAPGTRYGGIWTPEAQAEYDAKWGAKDGRGYSLFGPLRWGPADFIGLSVERETFAVVHYNPDNGQFE